MKNGKQPTNDELRRTKRRMIGAPVDSLVSDSDRLDWLQKVMTPRELYVEISFAGLRNGDADATAFQIEANPERFKVLNAPTLREAIDLAMKVCR